MAAPTLYITQIADKYIRANFENLRKYLQAQERSTPQQSQQTPAQQEQQTQASQSETSSESEGGLSGTPIGAMLIWPTEVLPSSEWMIVEDKTYEIEEYPELYAVIGDRYTRDTDAAGTFRLPPTAGRVILGVGNGSGLSPRALGATGGSETHVLSVSQIPSHGHTINHDHPSQVSGGQSSNHSHRLSYFSGGGFNVGLGGGGSGTANNYTAGTSSNHSHSTNLPNFNGNSGLSGGGEAHPNMQPWLALNFIIKYR